MGGPDGSEILGAPGVGPQAAGGAVSTLDGRPLRYNERDTLLNPHFLAVGDARREWHRLF